MWTTLALMSALNWTPAQAGQLELKNVRVTYGILGQERKESTYLPGDLVVLAFDIEGLKVTDDGQVRYSMSMELTDSKGKSLFKKDPDPQGTLAVNTLGKSRLPAFALTEVGTDTAPGKYTMTVVVTDVSAKDKKDRPTVELKRDFEVKPSRFGIVRPGFTNVSLKEPQPAPPLGVPGQSLFFNFAVVGFDLKGDKMEPNVKVKMEVLDETGKAVNEKPFTGEAKQIDEEAKKLRVIPFQLPMQLNRSGKFKVVVTATDEHTGKTATQTLDLKVVEVN